MVDYTVSGCIVTHNDEYTIGATLRTLLQSTQSVDLELFLVDNHSKDNTVAVAEKAAPEAHFLCNTKNIGFGAGHNKIIHNLQSKYHVIMNPDILLDQDAIGIMARYMDDHPDVMLCSPRIVFPITGIDQVLGKRNPTLRYLLASRLRFLKPAKAILDEYAMCDHDLTKPIEIENASGCFMMIRTDIFKQVGGFDERYFLYFEDCDLTRTLGLHGKTIYYPDAAIQHVWNRESKKNLRLMLVQIQSMIRYFRKWKNV
ncbi:MAG: glycosyltransferase family 2 protein [Oscillospiraceae bacterium]|jgi:GT2 family glycosyltransferase|nr:glycosyltransferase family 2 protein [Oscillospiraceae bacterium]